MLLTGKAKGLQNSYQQPACQRSLFSQVAHHISQSACEPQDVSGLLVVLVEEEKEAYEVAMREACDDNGQIDPITALHYSSAFQQHIASLIEIVLGASPYCSSWLYCPIVVVG